MEGAPTVGPLTKVSLVLTVSAKDAGSQPSASGIPFDFICGLAIEGLTAFEKDLLGKIPGDRVNIQVEPAQLQAYFEHLLCPLMDAVNIKPPFDFVIDVQSVAPVSERELVHALARKSEMNECQCGCGCK